MTVFAAEAAGVEDLVVGHQPLHRVDGLLTGGAHLLLGFEAERLEGEGRREVGEKWGWEGGVVLDFYALTNRK